MNFEAFREDPKTVAAVERKLQIISEAAIRPGDGADRLCPGLPWRNIRGLRIVTVDLPPLRRAVEGAVSRLRDSRTGGGSGP